MPKSPSPVRQPAARPPADPHDEIVYLTDPAPARHPRAEPSPYARAVDDRLGASGSTAEFGRKARFLDYETTRAMFEAWNAQLWDEASELLLWMSHPARHAAMQQTDEDDLDANGGYYGARKGCEPLHVQATGADGNVLAVNHTATAVTGAKVTAQLYALGGRPLRDAVSTTLDLPAGRGAGAFAVPFDRALPATHLLRLRLTDPGGRVLSVNDYCRYRTPTDMRSVNGLPSVGLSVRTRPAEGAAVTATVRNTGAAPAALVRLSLVDPDTGERVVSALADDNYLWLLPGESREVRLSWGASLHVTRSPRAAAEAYNAPRVVS